MTVHDDLEAYLLGALTPAETLAYEAHLAACAPCGDGLASYGPVMRGLRSLPLAVPPPLPAVRPVLPWARAAAAVVLLAAGLAGGSALSRPDPDTASIARMVAGRAREVALVGPGASGRALVGAARERTAFVVAGLPPPPPGRGYQVWVRGNGVRSPGMLHRTRDGLEVLVTPGDALAGAHRVGITLEAAGGSPRRLGPLQVGGEVL